MLADKEKIVNGRGRCFKIFLFRSNSLKAIEPVVEFIAQFNPERNKRKLWQEEKLLKEIG